VGSGEVVVNVILSLPILSGEGSIIMRRDSFPDFIGIRMTIVLCHPEERRDEGSCI